MGARSLTRLGLVVALLSLAVVSACGSSSRPGSTAEPRQFTYVEAEDRLPSESASDWVTYADYVVAVRPTSEQFQQPVKEELQHGEGSVLRKLTVTVDKVLWSSPTPARPAPDEPFHWLAVGYTFRDQRPDVRTPMASQDSPRFEVGHTYLVALSWEAARCTEGDHVPSNWNGLGSGGALPYDDGVIGQGEFAGREIDPTTYANTVPAGTLAAALAGKGETELVDALTVAKTERKRHYLPPPAPCHRPR